MMHNGLRRIREDARLSQREMAERLAVSQANINNWEWGKSRPQSRYHRSIATCLGISSPELDRMLATHADDYDAPHGLRIPQ